MEIGFKTNKLEFLGYSEPKIRINGAKRVRGLFRCDCGDEKTYDYSAVKTGHVKQCLKCGNKESSKKKIKHQLLNHPLYRKWQDMKNRCYNPKVDRYSSYGGRGIKVCEDWKISFISFYDWSLSNGWKKGLTIDRKDVSKDYCPENCRYITMTEQGFNKRNTFYVEINSVKYSLAKLMHLNGMSNKYRTVWCGLKKGKPIEYYIEKLSIDLSVYNFI